MQQWIANDVNIIWTQPMVVVYHQSLLLKVTIHIKLTLSLLKLLFAIAWFKASLTELIAPLPDPLTFMFNFSVMCWCLARTTKAYKSKQKYLNFPNRWMPGLHNEIVISPVEELANNKTLYKTSCVVWIK